jgi:hypothetical protein
VASLYWCRSGRVQAAATQLGALASARHRRDIDPFCAPAHGGGRRSCILHGLKHRERLPRDTVLQRRDVPFAVAGDAEPGARPESLLLVCWLPYRRTHEDMLGSWRPGNWAPQGTVHYILLIQDDSSGARAVRDALTYSSDGSFRVLWVRNCSEGLDVLARRKTPDNPNLECIAAIVDAVISMGKSLHMNVVAEGVETPQQLAFLQDHDCPFGQGYYFSRPLTGWNCGELLLQGIAPGYRASHAF